VGRGGGVQSLIEFIIAADKKLYSFLPQFGSSSVPLALPRRFSL